MQLSVKVSKLLKEETGYQYGVTVNEKVKEVKGENRRPETVMRTVLIYPTPIGNEGLWEKYEK